jgi:hypothetical protein
MGLVTSTSGWTCMEQYFREGAVSLGTFTINNETNYIMHIVPQDEELEDLPSCDYLQTATAQVIFTNGVRAFISISKRHSVGQSYALCPTPSIATSYDDYVLPTTKPWDRPAGEEIYPYYAGNSLEIITFEGGQMSNYKADFSPYKDYEENWYTLYPYIHDDSDDVFGMRLLVFPKPDEFGITFNSDVPVIHVPYALLWYNEIELTAEEKEEIGYDELPYEGPYDIDGQYDQEFIPYLMTRLGFYGEVDPEPEPGPEPDPGTTEKLVNNFRMQELITEIKRRLALKQDTTQLAQMSTASEDLLGNIYQYIGPTDSSYVNGYFYKCISDGASTPTYSWEHVVLEDLASATKNGLMTSAMYTKLNGITTASASNEGLMPAAMYTKLDGITDASASSKGLMSSAMYTKLDNITTASASNEGLMPAAMYTKLNNITTASATNEGLMPSAMYSTVDSLGLATDADIDALFA